MALHSPEGSVLENGSPEEPSAKRRRLDSNKDTGPTKNTRRKTACQACRLRKVKCDAARPTCNICKASDSVCEYTDPLSEKLTLESATELLSGKLDRLQNDIERLQTVAQQSSNQSHDVTTAARDGDHDRPSKSNSLYAAEPSKDFLQIPAHRTTADTVLNWDVFEGRYPAMALIGVLFTPVNEDDDSLTVSNGLLPPNEEQIPSLIDKFLQNVHTKNPVLDVEQLVKQSRIIASTGLRWDAWSCLVLVASALGTIAKPFNAAVTISPSPSADGTSATTWTPDEPTTQQELQQAESYFVLACRRMGGLKHSILGAQCYFFAGVYLMYTMRPLLSWQYFLQSSILYQLYMKRTHALATDITQLGQLPIERNSIPDSKRRRLEESMYWSCFKSESEFRVELPLQQSEIASVSHPQLFPSPPSPASQENDAEQPFSEIDGPYLEDKTSGRARTFSDSSAYVSEAKSLRQHAKRLCNEEESWYYYLTEIALRRIGNRIINTFFGHDPSTWLGIKPLIAIALEFDVQVSAWSAHLPAAMQHWEMNYTIRAPALGLPDGTGNPVSRELSWATDNRLLEMRSWLYQPFLYYFIHSEIGLNLPPAAMSSPVAAHAFSSQMQVPSRTDFISATAHEIGCVSTEDATALYYFITAGIECNLKILDVRSLRHRHHGLWYDMRSLMTASLILLAIVKSGKDIWIPGGAEVLWGFNSSAQMHEQPIEGKIGHVISEFEFWSVESPDLKRHSEVLEDVTRTVRTIWYRRRNIR